jgi:hypothetical protein
MKIFNMGAGHQWLTPVILATQEAEMGRTTVPGQPGQTVQETPISAEKNWVWWCMHVIPATVGSKNREIVVQTHLGKK